MKRKNSGLLCSRICVGLALLAASLYNASITPTYAGKPGGVSPPVDTGTIYFRLYIYSDAPLPSIELWTMKPDGTAKAKLLENVPVILEPSQCRHNTQRWFLYVGAIPGETYPDGRERCELFALSEGGAVVQVTHDPTVQPLLESQLGGIPRWVNWTGPDTRISYLGRRWGKDLDDRDVVVEAGLFVADINPDALGPGFIAPQPTLSPVAFPLFAYENYGLGAAYTGYDWSPNANQVVYGVPNDGLHLAGALTGQYVGRVTTDGVNPRWSAVRADGQTRIAFKSGGGWETTIQSVNPDGTGRIQVIPPIRSRGTLLDFSWSPAASHLAYDVLTEDRTGVKSVHIFRATAEGNNRTDLTREIDFARILGWRAEP